MKESFGGIFFLGGDPNGTYLSVFSFYLQRLHHAVTWFRWEFFAVKDRHFRLTCASIPA
jgi:hypothetical protein